MRKKFLAVSVSLMMGMNFPAYASNEVTVESGTEENLARGENNGIIDAEKQFDYVKYSKAVDLGNNLNRSFYAMAALIQDTGTYGQPGYKAAGNYAFLTNNGIINLHYKDIVAEYANQLDIYGDTSRTYDNIMGWGMLAGEHSTLINNGTIFNRSNSVVYGMSSPSVGTFTNNGKITAVSYGETPSQIAGVQIVQNPGAYGMVISPVGAGTFTNKGLINASIQSSENANAGAIAAGMMIFNTNSAEQITLENTGVINVSSDIPASAQNNYLPRVSEIAVHSMLQGQNAPRENSNLVIGNYATTFRDFGTTKDLIQARWANIDFSSTNLILRPAENYSAGESYDISADTLVTKIEDDTYTSTPVNVTGIDSMNYSAEMSDFITPNVTRISDGVYQVSLVPNNSGNAEDLISAAAMTPIDFTRANLDQLNHELERNDRLGQKWFFAPYYSKFNRDEGSSGHAQGYIIGSDWKIGKKSFGGIHAAYALGSAYGGIYSADSSLKSFLGGLHYTIYPEENKNWIRTQATFFHVSGNSTYTMPTATSTLSGKNSNNMNGFYISANAGMSNQLSDRNELRSEIGLSYLKLNDAPTIRWDLLGENISGYDMKFDKYSALYATAKTSLIHKFNDEDNLLFSLGLRGRLYAKKIGLNMMNTNFEDSVREDSVQGLVELAYRRNINNFFIEAGYQGIFGSHAKNHLFHAEFKMTF